METVPRNMIRETVVDALAPLLEHRLETGRAPQVVDRVTDTVTTTLQQDAADYKDREAVTAAVQQLLPEESPVTGGVLDLGGTGLGMQPLHAFEDVYTVTTDADTDVNPYQWWDAAANSFLDTCHRLLPQSRETVSAAEAVIQHPGQYTVTEVEQVLDPSEQAWKKADFAAATHTRDTEHIALHTLLQSLYSEAQHKPELGSVAEGFDRFFTRFNPGEYSDVLDNSHEYRFTVTQNPEHMYRMACATATEQDSGSCINGEDDKKWFNEFAADPFTFFYIAERDGEDVGYTRGKLYRTEEHTPFLGVHTFEVPHGRFQNYDDAVQSMGLAMLQLGQDIGAAFTAARDSRINAGLRQAYRDTQRSVEYRKIGERVWSVNFQVYNREDAYGNTVQKGRRDDAYLLLENWDWFTAGQPS